MTTDKLVEAQGYAIERHSCTTQDGYILTMHRIPCGRHQSTCESGKPIAFLQHGFLDSSATWVITDYDVGLGYLLADAGYDVWLGNSRGNTYSTNHTTLDPKDDAFWVFSWDEMAQYDLIANFKYIENLTGKNNFTYVGHSQGTAIGFAGFPKYPETAKYVGLFIALSPVAYCGHISAELLVVLAGLPEWLIHTFLGHKSVFESQGALDELLPILCKYLPGICEDTICVLAGCENTKNINDTALVRLMEVFPAGSSVQDLLKFAQALDTDKFQYFDYGSTGNQQHYNQKTPPQYSLSNFHTPTAYFYGSADKLADVTDVNHLLSLVPQVPIYSAEIANYGHADFVWGQDSAEKVYKYVLA
eukprot:CAMPEP_0174250068 /NCGR_PEP_ID=MMETSP0439-20130205/358_1 /TAXON_ID=0 /ORGANISM="Stereomyxa ramosa, Strain Chinc5" /LENGTH=359 /DNA_ID=CAMNT_0015330051 /DNA_START=123 /DNA_END=1199 /DNA_ORIENTATION=-